MKLSKRYLCCVCLLVCLSIVGISVGYIIGTQDSEVTIDTYPMPSTYFMRAYNIYPLNLSLYPLETFFPSKNVITRQTDFKYEIGIKITSDRERIENQVFIDIPIGIVVWSSNNYIANCTFMFCPDEGILLIGNNNTIENCMFYYCEDGIELQESSNNSFINNVYLNNSHAGIDAIHHSNNNNSFFNCMFYGNTMGVYFKQSENNSFTDCCFLKNKRDYVER